MTTNNERRTPEVRAISAAKTDVDADADADAAAELSNYRALKDSIYVVTYTTGVLYATARVVSSIQ